jgi:hypothetical protein
MEVLFNQGFVFKYILTRLEIVKIENKSYIVNKIAIKHKQS